MGASFRAHRALWCIAASATLTAAAGDYMNQSFFFDYTPDSQTITVPVTAQCETINVAWERTSGSTGPSPSAPYFLQIYTSAFVFPFIVEAGSALSFDWQVPFGPGTIYQVCMFDKNGYTGGCQGQYTMIANTTVDTVTCANASFPLGPLDIDAQVVDGPLSMYGWVNSCTDISITPKNGTAPYTVTVAPSLHPPANFTIAETNTTFNWTVDLSWSSPFFISVVDADFNRWSYGPLHSGDGDTDCLTQKALVKADDDDEDKSSGISGGAAAGIAIGCIIVGILVGAGGAWFLLWRRKSNKVHSPSMDQFLPSEMTRRSHSQRSGVGGQYEIEPFSMPDETPSSSVGTRGSVAQGAEAGRSVYVVHHDGGRAPITVYHEDGTEVVELPPRYAGSNAGSGSGSGDGTGTGTGSVLSGSEGSSRRGRPTSAGSLVPEGQTAQRTDLFNQPRQVGPKPKKSASATSTTALRPLRRLPSPAAQDTVGALPPS